jgi:hypothetical protein
MFRLWCKLVDDSRHIVKQTTVENGDLTVNRTKKIFDGIEEACHTFDVGQPIWLDANVAEFKRRSKVRFNQDNFIEHIDFAYMEVEVIEED